MSKHGGNRNFGYGKQLAYAGFKALQDRYQGRFATVAAHADRWKHFASFVKNSGVHDARDVTRALVERYGAELRGQVTDGEMSVRYAQNLLSTVNVVLSALRGDQTIRISPSATVGQRTHVREVCPPSINRGLIKAAEAELRRSGHLRALSACQLAREFGLRLKEASLLNLREALLQAESTATINITDGTKGGRGRQVDRWVPCSSAGLEALRTAMAVAGTTRNLIPATWTYARFKDHVHHTAGAVFARIGLGTVHDLRAAYACERYQALTGRAAPVVAGRRIASKADDSAARETISRELGHGRRDVAAAYLGSAR